MSKPNYQMLFSDIDGTLLDKTRNVSKETIKAISNIKEACPIVLISSRQPSAMYYLQEDLGVENSPLICYNGGLIIVANQIVDSTYINNNSVLQSLKKAKDLDLHLSLYFEDHWHAPRMDYWTEREINNTRVQPEVSSFDQMLQTFKKNTWGAHKMMGMGDPDKIDELIAFIEKELPNKMHCYRSKDTYVEISPKSISKKTAIEYLIENEYPQVDIDNCVAFGDNYNDMEMLQAVGTGVAMENAKNEVKAIANYITKTNKEHGVALFLNKEL